MEKIFNNCQSLNNTNKLVIFYFYQTQSIVFFQLLIFFSVLGSRFVNLVENYFRFENGGQNVDNLDYFLFFSSIFSIQKIILLEQKRIFALGMKYPQCQSSSSIRPVQKASHNQFKVLENPSNASSYETDKSKNIKKEKRINRIARKNGKQYRLKDSFERYKDKIQGFMNKVNAPKPYNFQTIWRECIDENYPKQKATKKQRYKKTANRMIFEKLIGNKFVNSLFALSFQTGEYEKSIIKAPRKMEITFKSKNNSPRGLLRSQSQLQWKLIENSQFYKQKVQRNEFDKNNVILNCMWYLLNQENKYNTTEFTQKGQKIDSQREQVANNEKESREENKSVESEDKLSFFYAGHEHSYQDSFDVSNQFDFNTENLQLQIDFTTQQQNKSQKINENVVEAEKITDGTIYFEFNV